MKRQLAVHILVIDDDPTVVRDLAAMLGAAGFHVYAANSLANAVALLAEQRCAVALVDLRLPDQSGPELIAALREAAPGMAILGLVAFPESSELVAAIDAGADDVLEKPLQDDVVVGKVEAHLARMGILARHEQVFNQRLGAQLRAKRIALRLTQQDVAALAQITPAQLSQIEHGKTATTTWTLARIGAALRMRLDELFAAL